MELTTICQIIYLIGTLIVCIGVVYLPRKTLVTNETAELSSRAVRILDLTNFFAVGVFLATCFVMLTPHVQSSFVKSFTKFGWEMETCYKFIQMVVVIGFLFVFFLEKVLDYCKKGDPSSDDMDCHLIGRSSKNSSPLAASYVVTFEDGDNELNRNEIEKDNLENKTNSINSASGDMEQQSDNSHEEDDEDDEDDESKRLVTEGKDDDDGRKKGKFFRRKQVTFLTDKDRNNSNNQSQLANHGCKKLVIGGPHPVPLRVGPKEGRFDVRCAAMLIALCVHSVFEGMTLGLQTQFWRFFGLAGAVAIHQVVAAAAVGVSLTRRRLGRLSFFLSSLLFSGAIPLGILVGILLSILTDSDIVDGSPIAKAVSASLQALTVGTFVYVIFVEILPSEFDKKKDQLIKAFLLIVGFVLVTCIAFFLAKS